jgi:hypothetical protein
MAASSPPPPPPPWVVFRPGGQLQVEELITNQLGWFNRTRQQVAPGDRRHVTLHVLARKSRGGLLPASQPWTHGGRDTEKEIQKRDMNVDTWKIHILYTVEVKQEKISTFIINKNGSCSRRTRRRKKVRKEKHLRNDAIHCLHHVIHKKFRELFLDMARDKKPLLVSNMSNY